MEEYKEFDFNKNYSNEKEAPPAFFWNDLEAQLAVSEKKRPVIVWFRNIAAIGVSAILLGIAISYFSADRDSTQPKTVQNTTHKKQQQTATATPNTTTEDNAVNTGIAKEENNTSKLPLTAKKETIIPSLPQNKELRAFTGNNTPLYTKKAENTTITEVRNSKTNRALPTPIQGIVLPNLEQNFLVKNTHQETAVPDTAVKKNKNENVVMPEEKNPLGWFVAVNGFGHTHSFANYAGGARFGIGYKKAIAPKWSASATFNYIEVNNPDITRVSQQEHFFLSRTITQQELQAKALFYLAPRLQVNYHLKNNIHLMAGIETWWLAQADSKLYVTEIHQNEDRTTKTSEINDFTKGISKFVPQISLGAVVDISQQLSMQMSLNRSLTPYGEQLKLGQTKPLHINYLSLGVNWYF